MAQVTPVTTLDVIRVVAHDRIDLGQNGSFNGVVRDQIAPNGRFRDRARRSLLQRRQYRLPL